MPPPAAALFKAKRAVSAGHRKLIGGHDKLTEEKYDFTRGHEMLTGEKYDLTGGHEMLIEEKYDCTKGHQHFTKEQCCLTR